MAMRLVCTSLSCPLISFISPTFPQSPIVTSQRIKPESPAIFHQSSDLGGQCPSLAKATSTALEQQTGFKASSYPVLPPILVQTSVWSKNVVEALGSHKADISQNKSSCYFISMSEKISKQR